MQTKDNSYDYPYFRSYRHRDDQGTLYPVIVDKDGLVLFAGLMHSNHLGQVIRATNDLNAAYAKDRF